MLRNTTLTVVNRTRPRLQANINSIKSKYSSPFRPSNSLIGSRCHHSTTKLSSTGAPAIMAAVHALLSVYDLYSSSSSSNQIKLTSQKPDDVVDTFKELFNHANTPHTLQDKQYVEKLNSLAQSLENTISSSVSHEEQSNVYGIFSNLLDRLSKAGLVKDGASHPPLHTASISQSIHADDGTVTPIMTSYLPIIPVPQHALETAASMQEWVLSQQPSSSSSSSSSQHHRQNDNKTYTYHQYIPLGNKIGVSVVNNTSNGIIQLGQPSCPFPSRLILPAVIPETLIPEPTLEALCNDYRGRNTNIPSYTFDELDKAVKSSPLPQKSTTPVCSTPYVPNPLLPDFTPHHALPSLAIEHAEPHPAIVFVCDTLIVLPSNNNDGPITYVRIPSSDDNHPSSSSLPSSSMSHLEWINTHTGQHISDEQISKAFSQASMAFYSKH